MLGRKKCLVIFDFDHSLIDDNSDTYVFKKLKPELYHEINTLRRGEFSGQWTKLMDHLVGRMMMKHGVTLTGLNECLATIPVFCEIIEAIELARSKGAELAILSDANEHYIDVILRYHNIHTAFSRIVTNVGRVVVDDPTTGTGSEVLRILPYQDLNSPHNCSRCPPNLCKGAVLAQWIESLKSVSPRDDDEKLQLIYIGDGGGDFCPCMRLRVGDVVLCRENWTLHHMIQESPDLVRAQVVPWAHGRDILHFFKGTFF